MRRRYRLRIAMLATCALTVSGCRNNLGGPRDAVNPAAWAGFAGSAAPVLVGYSIKPAKLTESEMRYGIAPSEGAGVIYQDGVLVMEHGDRAIRSYSSNGMVWTFAADAPHVSSFEVGKTIFATSRCVGKILVMQTTGDRVSVILGPAQLTDVIKEGNFHYDAPLDLDSLIATPIEDYPGAANSMAYSQPEKSRASLRKVEPTKRAMKYFVISPEGKWTVMRTAAEVPKPKLMRAGFDLSSQSGIELAMGKAAPSVTSASPFRKATSTATEPGNELGSMASAPMPGTAMPRMNFDNMHAEPCTVGCGGIGIRVDQEKNGVTFRTSAVLRLHHPRILFNASVRSNGSVHATVQLSGAEGITVRVDAGNAQDALANLHEVKLIPVEIAMPIGGMLVPLSVMLSQSIDIDTAFSAESSTIHGMGEVDIDGEISGSYSDGTWNLSRPGVKLNKNLAGLVSGTAKGTTSVVFRVEQRVMVGIGSAGFAAGPYVDLYTSMTALNQSNGSRVPCAQGTLNMQLGAGIGYGMPKVVASVINAFLGSFHAAPVLPWGSIVSLPPRASLFDRVDQVPSACAGIASP